MGIYEGIFIEENFTAGEAVAYGKLVLYNTYPNNPNNNINLFSYWNNLMGDGSTHLWTKRPELITVNHVSSIQPGTNFIDIEVLNSNNSPVKDAYVTLLKGNDEIFISDYTNSNGLVTLNIDDVGSGEILVTVVKQDHKPSQSTISIANNNVVISLPESEINIIDDLGNGDGNINPGENIDLQIRLYNSGNEVLSGLNAQLVSSSTQLSIIDDGALFAYIDANSYSEVGDFSFSVDPDGIDETSLDLRLNLISDQGSWN